MRVNNIQSPMNFQGLNQKIIRGKLKDGSDAVLRLTFKNSKINSLEGYCFKDGQALGGAGFGKNGGADTNEITAFIKRLQANAQDGTNFFKAYTKALLEK